MASQDLSDGYLASLIAKDAKDSSLKYSSMGLDAFLSPRTSSNKPKPNTRFLRNLVKETDSHNAALLAREAADSKARLRRLEKGSERSAPDVRKRQLGLIAAHLSAPTSRRKIESGRQYRQRQSPAAKQTTPPDECDGYDRDDRVRTRRLENDSERRTDGRSTSERVYSDHHHRHRLSRSRSRSPRQSEDRDQRHSYRSHRRRRRSRSPSHSEARSQRRHRNRERAHRMPIDADLEANHEDSRQKAEVLDEDSDPLDDIIGLRPAPEPKVTRKGRGIVSAASGIDNRFSRDYDPTTDVALDPAEEDDWGLALEALRDRQKFKQHGADRLRAAGFTEEEISKWEKNGMEKSEADVRWAKQGETKEWDRGKIVQDNDNIAGDVVVRRRTPEVDMSFGRLSSEW